MKLNETKELQAHMYSILLHSDLQTDIEQAVTLNVENVNTT